MNAPDTQPSHTLDANGEPLTFGSLVDPVKHPGSPWASAPKPAEPESKDSSP